MINPSPPFQGVIDKLQQEAEILENNGVSSASAGHCIELLEQWWCRYLRELLTVREAAKETNLSQSTIRDRLAKGKLENRGQPGKPLIRRIDLARHRTIGAPPNLVGVLLSKRRED
jgi:hypothetical protein